MDIQSAAMHMSQAGIREQAAVQVQAMGLSAAKEQGEALSRLMESAAVITDPNLGRMINVSV